ncbi:SET domain-containing protein SmydA-8 isoform X2 [Folsomia candida]|uniref:Protein msta, isoform A n=1 Tax=Folsomia candida TaxID=158441 RepID=A0A226EPP7_FOLCA|nr:SET domain-containing protein SmydA-8 isoform X2 [Folsomia candida]OXA58556.1 Protein msta, isoform A [Folsomia candida]
MNSTLTANNHLESQPTPSSDEGEKSEKCPVCQENADKICSGCSSVFYCSTIHQKEHWKNHKESCRPYVIKKNEVYGRYLVAARDLPQGTIVLTESPLVVGPKRTTYPVCLGCHQRVDCSYHCSKCGFPVCNESCENNPNHSENECPIFQKGHSIGSRITDPTSCHPAYEAVTPLRCILLRSRDPAKWARLNTMEHHNEYRSTLTTLWNRNEVNTLKLIREWYKMKDEYDAETIHTCIGFVDVNCFEIKYQNIEICGLYPETSLMGHDCVPNTVHATTTGPSFRMIVRTSLPIRKGEIISTSYVDALKTTTRRRKFLKNTKYFDCFCPRCKDPTEFGTFLSAMKCGQCSSGYLLPKNPVEISGSSPDLDQVLWYCTSSSCSNSVKYGKLASILNKVEKEIESADSCGVGSRISRLERMLKKFSGKVLHPNHALMLGLMKTLTRAYLNEWNGNELEIKMEMMEMLQRKKELCLQLLHVLDLVDPGLSRPRGVTLYQLFTAELPIARIQLSQGEITGDDFIAKVDEILEYLTTTKTILDLDRLIVDYPTLALSVDKAIDTMYEEKSRVQELLK